MSESIKGLSGKVYSIVVGLEIHAQVLAKSKLFSSSSTLWGSKPNSSVTYLDAAMPGTLPSLNRNILHQAIKTSVALNCKVNKRSMFERKHYFYCDLPLGFQITQQRAPIAENGSIAIFTPLPGNIRKFRQSNIRIARIQMEQDSGKSIHDFDPAYTFVDLNRAGCALLELVTQPDIKSSSEAGAFIRSVRHLLQHIKTCDGNMAEGSLRVDVNVSVKPIDSDKDFLGQRTEIKNLNSVRHVMRAIEYEAARHVQLLDSGKNIEYQTMNFDASSGITIPIRNKENTVDYRFIPEPDLPIVHITDNELIDCKNSMPELPFEQRERLISIYKLDFWDANILAEEPQAVEFFETVAKGRDSLLTCKWIVNDLFGLLNAASLSLKNNPMCTKRMGDLIDMVFCNKISRKNGQEILKLIVNIRDTRSIGDIVIEKKMLLITDLSILEQMIQEVILENPKEYTAYKKGKTKLFGFFVGKVIAKSNGNAEPTRVNSILIEKLKP